MNLNVRNLLVGLLLAGITYFAAGLFLPHTLAVLIALLVLVLAVFGNAI